MALKRHSRRSAGRHGQPAQTVDLSEDVGQTLLPLRAGLGQGDADLAVPDIQERTELRFQPAFVTVPADG